MTGHMSNSHSVPDRQNQLWGAFVASISVFLINWFMSWGKAYVINDDLPNFCGDVRRSLFPPEVACMAENGTITGGNAWWVEPLFFASGVLSLVFAVLALRRAAVSRKA
ncbi:hypothetical protein [Streptomyces ureilyticus]|uniref:Uncharacterized protein n=1 Tax=Streptomyces ureilyticus TaxID=1775131 RepID=A0ABX0DWI8_9ACTN|nr:hypothetical protein [Streptomyces ureilyticus]NGO46302.1 hypothetical protein [Streptomyces ureilyticus]